MMKLLVKKGWEKNEIIYEMQRVFGNDVLIHVRMLDDERTLFGRVGLPLFYIFSISGIVMLSRFRQVRRIKLN